MRISTLRLHSVRYKKGGADIVRVLHGKGARADHARGEAFKSLEDITKWAGADLRGYVVAVYDKDGCFNVAYDLDGEVLKLYDLQRAFTEALGRALVRG